MNKNFNYLSFTDKTCKALITTSTRTVLTNATALPLEWLIRTKPDVPLIPMNARDYRSSSISTAAPNRIIFTL